MTPDTPDLTHNELTVLESLHGASKSVSQRELARRTGFSVGLINAVIKKLVRTGYVKTAHLNRRQLEYLLTAEGFARTALRSYSYVVETVHRFRAVHASLKSLVEGLQASGAKRFYLHGDGELADLVEAFFAEMGCGELTRGIPTSWCRGEPGRGSRRLSAQGLGEVIFNAQPSEIAVGGGRRVVNLVAELGNGGSRTAPAASAAPAVNARNGGGQGA